jgi:hypothetical protein
MVETLVARARMWSKSGAKVLNLYLQPTALAVRAELLLVRGCVTGSGGGVASPRLPVQTREGPLSLLP